MALLVSELSLRNAEAPRQIRERMRVESAGPHLRAPLSTWPGFSNSIKRARGSAFRPRSRRHARHADDEFADHRRLSRRDPGLGGARREAAELFPSGITHDSRYIEPYGLYITRAEGPRKWDVDGRCYVDYFGGHGALLLGHCHPKVMAAVHAQLDRGTHYGASHELEIDWAERVMRLIPTAERVRFTSSGTEATLMAVRLARAFSGKPKMIRFNHHFHGWHDHMTSGHANHFDGSRDDRRARRGVAGNVLLCDQNDEAGLAQLLEQHDDIAAAIIEPTGANGGRLPIDPNSSTRCAG